MAKLLALILVMIGVSGAVFLARAQSESTTSAVEARHAGFEGILSALRQIDREAKAEQPDLAAMASSNARLIELEAEIPSWFPLGSGTESGAKTTARPEIWTDRQGFVEKAAASLAAARGLSTSVRTGNLEAIRDTERTLVKTCQACHHAYEYGNF